MASLKDIRNRIQSVKKTQKTTNAMQMVSAAKLKRAQDAIEAAAPYSNKLRQVVSNLSARFSEEDHSLFAKTGKDKVAVILMASDRGLCGGFNSNLAKATLKYVEELGAADVSFIAFGRKGRDFVKSTHYASFQEHVEIPASQLHQTIQNIAQECISLFESKQFDRIYLAYNQFESVISQVPTVNQLLPIEPPQGEVSEDERDVVFEPSPEAILDQLLRQYVQNQIHTASLSSIAGEHASRMTAMDSATKNAGEMINKLQLYYNRTRQAAITRELIEIVSGAESL